MKITVVYDNFRYSKGFKTGWGFSALIENGLGEKMLFDTGADAGKLIFNMEKFSGGINEIKAIAFSHLHWDHTDGTGGLLMANRTAKLYLPPLFEKKFKKPAESFNHEIKPIAKNGGRVMENCSLTPLYKKGEGPAEEGLIIKARDTAALVTGCAHPGILFMLKEAKKIAGRNIDMVMGGFHLKDSGVEEVEKLTSRLKEEGVRFFAPCHCTGEKQTEVFKRKCGGGFIKTGAGREVEFN